MTSTTVIGQRTKNSLEGRDASYHGHPILIADLLAQLGGTAYVARASVHDRRSPAPRDVPGPARLGEREDDPGDRGRVIEYRSGRAAYLHELDKQLARRGDPFPLNPRVPPGQLVSGTVVVVAVSSVTVASSEPPHAPAVMATASATTVHRRKCIDD